MAKESGLSMTVNLDDSSDASQDISNDVTNLSWEMPRATQDITGVDKSAIERLLLLADFSLDLNGVFNDATDASHDVLKDHNSTSQARDTSVAISGQTLSAVVFPTSYNLTRAATGEFTWTSTLVNQDGNAPAWS